MRKYTTDPCILKILECFFDHHADGLVSADEVKFNSFFKRIVHECISQDKLYFLAFWISIMKVRVLVVVYQAEPIIFLFVRHFTVGMSKCRFF